MSGPQESGRGTAKRRILTVNRVCLLLAVVLLLGGALLYLRHAFQFFMDDDEGTYAYAAWRISLGEVPYRDFLTSEMPLFLYWGGLLVRLFGRSFVALRLATMGATVLAGGLFYAANRELFGRRVALLSLGLFLVDPNVYGVARCFRAEAYMLLFQIAGLWAFALGEKRNRLGYTVLAGVLFGLATLSKLFGLLPLVGCEIYLLYARWRERRPWRVVVRQGLALGLPVLALVGLAAVVFTWITPYFFTAVFSHHTMQGAGMPMAERATRGLEFLRSFVDGRRLIALMALAGAALALRRQKALPSLYLWLLPTALGFLLFSRDLYGRYLLYLTPAMATLSALAVARLLAAWRQAGALRRPWRAGAQALVLLAALALQGGAVFPWLKAYAADTGAQEHDSARLAALIQSLTNERQAVITDYPGLNFLAGRRSTYWAAELSGVSAQSGQVTGAALIEEMQQQVVGAVVIHTRNGAHHLVGMADYAAFRNYVQSYYDLVGSYEGAQGQAYELYATDGQDAPSTIAPVRVLPSGESLAVPSVAPIAHPLRSASFGHHYDILGYDVSADSVGRGDTLRVALNWAYREPSTVDYKVFVHLLDGAEQVQAQCDRVPAGGGARTCGWVQGDVLVDHFEIPIPPTVPAGPLQIEVGFYDLASGHRLPLLCDGQHTDEDRLILPVTITVR